MPIAIRCVASSAAIAAITRPVATMRWKRSTHMAILRCNPWTPGGYDPVPRPKNTKG